MLTGVVKMISLPALFITGSVGAVRSQPYAIRSGNTPTVEITPSVFSIRICNGADPALVSRAFQLLKEFPC